MSAYSFTTVWRVRAPLETVWEAITRVSEWPTWWRGVLAVETLREGGADGVGAIHRYTWKSRLPYRLVFDIETVRVEKPTRIEGRALGELEGTGAWTLSESSGTTTARYDWRVRTTRPWMNLLAPLARPFFTWNHDVVMRWGAEGLARKLGTRVADLS